MQSSLCYGTLHCHAHQLELMRLSRLVIEWLAGELRIALQTLKHLHYAETPVAL